MPVDTTDSITPLFTFEEVCGRIFSHRDPQQARQQLSVLWARLRGRSHDLAAVEHHDPRGWQFLLRYVTDGPLSIEWYERKHPELELKQNRYNALVFIVALVLFGLAFALPFQPLLLTMVAGDQAVPGQGSVSAGLVDIAALVAVITGGATVALRMSAQVVRYRRQAAVFHKASAALKEQLYRLESEWTSRPLLDPTTVQDQPRLHPEFVSSLRRAVTQAQSILAEERDAYFDTLIVDVGAITDSTTSVAQTLGRSPVFFRDRRHEQLQARREQQALISQAKLEREVVGGKLEVLEAELATLPPEERQALQHRLRDLRLSRREADDRWRHQRQRFEAEFGALPDPPPEA